MTTAHATDEWVPIDHFGARLALIRQHLDLNIRAAARLCDVGEKSWRDWESGGSPRNYEAVCRQIAEKTGCSLTWLQAGGRLIRPGGGGQPGLLTSWKIWAGREECQVISLTDRRRPATEQPSTRSA